METLLIALSGLLMLVLVLMLYHKTMIIGAEIDAVEKHLERLEAQRKRK
jgi:hypothetical protein